MCIYIYVHDCACIYIRIFDMYIYTYVCVHTYTHYDLQTFHLCFRGPTPHVSPVPRRRLPRRWRRFAAPGAWRCDCWRRRWRRYRRPWRSCGRKMQEFVGIQGYEMVHNIWLVVWNMNVIFHFIWDNPSHWRTHIVQRGRYTTNQIWLILWLMMGNDG